LLTVSDNNESTFSVVYLIQSLEEELIAFELVQGSEEQVRSHVTF